MANTVLPKCPHNFSNHPIQITLINICTSYHLICNFFILIHFMLLSCQFWVLLIVFSKDWSKGNEPHLPTYITILLFFYEHSFVAVTVADCWDKGFRFPCPHNHYFLILLMKGLNKCFLNEFRESIFYDQLLSIHVTVTCKQILIKQNLW